MSSVAAGRDLAPRVRLQRRLQVDPRRAALMRIGGVVVALLAAGLALAVTGRPALSLAGEAVTSTFGERLGLEQTAIIATPILLDAIAVAVSLRMRLWNIGVEGQFYMGAWAAAGVGIYVDAPAPLLLVLMALAGAVGGALWIAVPAIARAYWNVNEIITTLLLNFVAVTWVEWFSIDLWRDREAEVIQATPLVGARLPDLFGSTVLHVGFLLPLLLAAFFWVVFRYGRWGYEVDMIGGNPRAAAFAGISVRRRIVTVMLISGAIAGISGMVHLAGATGRLQGTISNGYGLSGFIVAALAGASFLGLVVGGLFIALLLHSGIVLQTSGLSVYIVVAVYGVVLVGIAVAEMAARYRLVIGRRPPAAPGAERAPP
ncbi:MAG: ABC transporter permease [Actinomycetota bacterium]